MNIPTDSAEILSYKDKTVLWKCPVKDCGRWFRKPNAMGRHLYEKHLKAEIVKELMRQIGAE